METGWSGGIWVSRGMFDRRHAEGWYIEEAARDRETEITRKYDPKGSSWKKKVTKLYHSLDFKGVKFCD